jgi:hypothetical protein
MRHRQLLASGVATAVALISLSMLSAQSPAQKAPDLQCNGARILDPFKGKLAGDFPAGLLPIDDKVRDSIFASGLPCQENVTPVGQFAENTELHEPPAGSDVKQRGTKPAAREC